MKKILPALVLGSLLAVLAIPLVASAQEGPIECCKLRRAIELDGETYVKNAVIGPRAMTTAECPAGAVTSITNKWGLICFLNTLNTVVDWMFVILIAVAVLFVVMGGMNIIMAGGDPEKVTTGRKYVMYAFIGLIVAFIARAIPSIVKMAMGY